MNKIPSIDVTSKFDNIPEHDNPSRVEPHEEGDSLGANGVAPKAPSTTNGAGQYLDAPSISPIADAIDVKALRLDQGFASLVGVSEELVAISVGKPPKHEFVRVHPDPVCSMSTWTLKMRGENRDEVYLIDRPLWAQLANELVPMIIVLAVTNTGAPFLWPLRAPALDGRVDNWSKSALAAAQMARTAWVRVFADTTRGLYRVLVAEDDLGEPKWPTETFEELVKLAFGNHFIHEPNDPVLRRLRGRL